MLNQNPEIRFRDETTYIFKHKHRNSNCSLCICHSSKNNKKNNLNCQGAVFGVSQRGTIVN